MPVEEEGPQSEVDGEHRRFHDDLLDKLAGEWSVRGTVVGQEIRHLCTAEWVLNHQFMRVHFQDVTPRGGTGKEDPPYEAFVFIGYDNMSERYVGHWLDTFGGRASETLGFGKRDEGDDPVRSITFVFEGGTGPLQNTLAWNDKDATWTMIIRQKDDRGAWRTFAEETFERTSVAKGPGSRR